MHEKILKKVLSYIHHCHLFEYVYHSNICPNIKYYKYRSDMGLDYNEFNKKHLINVLIAECDVEYIDNSTHPDRSKD